MVIKDNTCCDMFHIHTSKTKQNKQKRNKRGRTLFFKHIPTVILVLPWLLHIRSNYHISHCGWFRKLLIYDQLRTLSINYSNRDLQEHWVNASHLQILKATVQLRSLHATGWALVSILTSCYIFKWQKLPISVDALYWMNTCKLQQ